MEADLVSAQYGIGQVNERVIYLIRLPLFVFMAGLLMPTSVERRKDFSYLKLRLGDLLWVYVLWSLLQGAVEVLTSSVKNVPTTWPEVLNLWVPRAQLWYLPFLAIISIAIVAAKPWRGGVRLWISLGAALIFSAGMWGHDGTTILTRGMSLTIFLVLGATVGARRLIALWDRTSFPVLLAAAILGLATAAWIGLTTPAIMPTSHLLLPWSVGGVALGLVGSLGGMLGAIALVLLVCRLFPVFERASAFVGRHSMAVYLGHITAMAGVRILLLRVGVESVWMHTILGTVVGTSASLLIVALARHLPWLLRAPQVLRR